MPDLTATQPYGSYTTLPNPGASPGGSSGDPSGSSIDWGAVAGAGAGLLAGAFAPSPTNPMPTIKDTQAGGKALMAKGADLTKTMDPALAYWQKLMSGNPSDLLAATTPERTRILDQYDTARANIGKFTPRGGGTSAAVSESFAKEAGDVASLTATKRDEAAKSLAAVGQAGLSAEEAGNQILAQTIGPLLNQENQDTQAIWKTVAGYAALAAAFI